jgi:hypothetical protein
MTLDRVRDFEQEVYAAYEKATEALGKAATEALGKAVIDAHGADRGKGSDFIIAERKVTQARIDFIAATKAKETAHAARGLRHCRHVRVTNADANPARTVDTVSF